MGLVDVADRRDTHVRTREQAPHVAGAHAADTYRRDVDPVVGRSMGLPGRRCCQRRGAGKRVFQECSSQDVFHVFSPRTGFLKVSSTSTPQARSRVR